MGGKQATATKPATSATMASIARGRTTVEKPVETVGEPTKVADTPAAVTWEDLPEAEVTTYKRGTVADLEESIPAPVKARVKAGFEATAKKEAPVWFFQQCGSAARAEEFFKLARKYATFCEMTLKGKVVTKVEQAVLVSNGKLSADVPDGSVVSYSVGNKQTRTRLTAEQKAAKAAAKVAADAAKVAA